MSWKKLGQGVSICAVLWFVTVTADIPQAFARDVTLVWESSEDPSVDGYLVYYKEGGPGEPNNLGSYEVIMRVPIDEPTDPNSLSDPGKPELRVSGLDEIRNYYFVVAAYDEEDLRISKGSREIFILSAAAIPPEFGNSYNRCWGVSYGDLEGFAMLYNSIETITPSFGSSLDIPAFNLKGLHPVGRCLSLLVEPPLKGSFVFSVPVTLLVPVPDSYGPDHWSIGLYESTWTLAWDGESGSQKGGWDWLDAPPLYRSVNPFDSLSRPGLELRVNHFSGIQLAQPIGATGPGGEGGGGCFVSTLFGNN
jgi:hypothetical protein